MDFVGKEVYPLPVMLYGKPANEGTIRVRERFEALGVSFVDVDLDEGETAARYVEEINNGVQTIPTVVFGDE